VDLLERQVTGERLMTREALRSRQSDAFVAGAIASDHPTKGGVDRPGLKDGPRVIYLSAREGVGPRQATTRDAGAHFLRYLGAWPCMLGTLARAW